MSDELPSVYDIDSNFMESNPGGLHNSVSDLLTCKICFNTLRNPKSLPCLHTFCYQCLRGFYRQYETSTRRFPCPACRRQIVCPRDGISAFPDSIFANALNDIINGSSSSTSLELLNAKRISSTICCICNSEISQLTCSQCKIDLCENCSQAHRQTKVTAGHNLLPISQNGNYCPIHRQHLLNYYCSNCSQCICVACVTLNHSGDDHDVNEIALVASSIANELKELLKVSDINSKNLIETKDELGHIERELKIMNDKVISYVKAESHRRRRLIQEEEQQLLKKIEKLYDVNSIRIEKNRIDSAYSNLETERRLITELLSDKTSPVAQVVAHSDIEKSLKRALSVEMPKIDDFRRKLDKRVIFLPAPMLAEDNNNNNNNNNNNGKLGNVILADTNTDTKYSLEPREILPTSRLVYRHSLKLPLSNNTCSSTNSNTVNKLDIMGLTFLPGNHIAVLCSHRKYKLLIFNHIGRLILETGNDDILQQPTDIELTSYGNLAITDCGTSTVKIIDYKSGQLKSTWTCDHFELPIAICKHPTRSLLLVCDQGRKTLSAHKEITGEALFETHIEADHVSIPQYITATSHTVLVADSENNVIGIYCLETDKINYICQISTNQQPPIFTSVSGIGCDRYGVIFITDTISNSIQAIRPHKNERHIVQIAGHSLRRPRCISVQNNGDHLIAIVHLGPNTPEPTEMDLTKIDIFRLISVDI